MILRSAAAIAAAGAALIVSLPSGAPSRAEAAGPAGSCFYMSQLESTRAADARTLYARVGGNRYYRLVMKSDCEGMRGNSETIVLKPFSSTGSICGPADVDVYLTSHGTAQHCAVDSITRMSPDEVASLPKRDTP
jgi:hypothetical protein